MVIEVYKDRRAEWRWRARARNGRIVADGGEGYSTLSNARRAARRIGFSIALAKIIIDD